MYIPLCYFAVLGQLNAAFSTCTWVHVKRKDLLLPDCRARGYAAAWTSLKAFISHPGFGNVAVVFGGCESEGGFWLRALKAASVWLHLLSVVFGSVWEQVSLSQRLKLLKLSGDFLGTPAPSCADIKCSLALGRILAAWWLLVRCWCLAATSVCKNAGMRVKANNSFSVTSSSHRASEVANHYNPQWG